MASDQVSEQQQRIDQALELVAAAQREVDQALGELTADAARANKQIIGQVLRDALDKLSEAKLKLEQARPDPRR